jgi:anti-sigma regulatory factor (Ser/Thr protein kinase)
MSHLSWRGGDVDAMREHETTKFEVTARPQAVHDARDRVRKTLADWGFDTIADELILCLSEVLTNSITHAAHSDTVTVCAWCKGALVHVEVVDCDKRLPQPRVPAEVMLSAPPLTGPQLEEHGRGLYLLEALSSRWGITTKPPGKCVWFEKDTEPDPLIGVSE